MAIVEVAVSDIIILQDAYPRQAPDQAAIRAYRMQDYATIPPVSVRIVLEGSRIHGYLLYDGLSRLRACEAEGRATIMVEVSQMSCFRDQVESPQDDFIASIMVEWAKANRLSLADREHTIASLCRLAGNRFAVECGVVSKGTAERYIKTVEHCQRMLSQHKAPEVIAAELNITPDKVSRIAAGMPVAADITPDAYYGLPDKQRSPLSSIYEVVRNLPADNAGVSYWARYLLLPALAQKSAPVAYLVAQDGGSVAEIERLNNLVRQLHEEKVAFSREAHLARTQRDSLQGALRLRENYCSRECRHVLDALSVEVERSLEDMLQTLAINDTIAEAVPQPTKAILARLESLSILRDGNNQSSVNPLFDRLIMPVFQIFATLEFAMARDLVTPKVKQGYLAFRSIIEYSYFFRRRPDLAIRFAEWDAIFGIAAEPMIPKHRVEKKKSTKKTVAV